MMSRRRQRRSRGRIVLLVIVFLLAAAAVVLVRYLGCNGTCSPVTSPATDTAPPESVPQQQAFSTDVRGQLLDAEQLTAEQQQLMTTLLDRWYAFIGPFEEQEMGDLFTDSAEAQTHMAACRTLVAIREAGLTDLRMTDVTYTLRVTSVTQKSDTLVRVEADEDVTMHFAATPEVDSQVLALPHIYELQADENGTWRIAHHEADDNPYFSFTRESDGAIGQTDARMQLMLQDIAARQAARRQITQPSPPAVDHPYDREAALRYMYDHIDVRSSSYYAYDRDGGNCMNFASQVLLSGGIPLDNSGSAVWYYYDRGNLSLPWINVGRFFEYARDNTGFGLSASVGLNYYTGEVGDLLILGVDGGHNHTTIISGLVRDESGAVVDYLISCNTTNCRDFPASAYYYTSHDLIKIWGWND